MNKCENILKLIICAFAFVGLAACGGGGSANTSNTDTVNILTDDVNQDSLSNYTLDNLDDTFLAEITQQNFNKTTTTITATTNIPVAQTKNIKIPVGTEYEDEVGNSPDTNQQLYEIDVQLLTVETVDSESNEDTDIENDYTVTASYAKIYRDNQMIGHGC